MSTSLAQQLQRLRAPQTSLLVEKKKQASILFDQKDAATKSKKIIFDLGYSGLMELAEINPSFSQFQDTLFDKNTKDLERAVESAEVNRILDKNIRKFFYHLSPFFMLEPAHKCLEWLIRRFHIHEFNKKDFFCLIFPYHETMIFVKCVQIMNLKDPNSPWKWIEPIQKPGVPLAKSTIINVAATDSVFLENFCTFTTKAIKELGNKAHMLQTQINFYCLIIIGALENSKEINEKFIINILPSLLKGFSSKIIDFTAASYMITAQLISKVQLSEKLLTTIINKIRLINHKKMHSDALLLLILIYQKQQINFEEKSSESFINFISNKWVLTTLGSLSAQSISITALTTPLIVGCLRFIQSQNHNWENCKIFLENLVQNVHFNEDEAKHFLSLILDNYHRIEPEESKDNEIIEIDSGDEEDQNNKEIQAWYSEYFQSLEKQYPTEFDYTIKDALQGRGTESEFRKQALKKLLAFRLKYFYSENNAIIYESLYHHSAINRVEAVKYLVKNLENLNTSENCEQQLKEIIIDRLDDDSSKAVYEILKIPTVKLIKILTVEVLMKKLIHILNKGQHNLNIWKKAVIHSIKHITTPEFYNECDKNIIALILFTYLIPGSTEEMIFVKEILSSRFCDDSLFLKKIASEVQNESDYKEIVMKVINALEQAKGLPHPKDVFASIKKIEKQLFHHAIHLSSFLLIIKSCYIKGIESNIGIEILHYVEKYLKKFKLYNMKNKENWIKVSRTGKIPSELLRSFLSTLAINTKINNPDDLSSVSMKLFLKIYKRLLTNACTVSGYEKEESTATLQGILDSVFSTPEKKLNFLSNFYFAENMLNPIIDIPLQIRSFKICNLIITKILQNNFNINLTTLIKVLIGLTSKISIIRECTLETLQLLTKHECLEKKYDFLITSILQRREEIIIDEEQFALILFTIISPTRRIKNESNLQKEYASQCLSDFLSFLNDENSSNDLKVKLLDILKHINNPQMLKKLIKLALNVIKDLDKMKEESTEIEILCLNKSKSNILKFIMSRIDESTVKVIYEEDKAWDLIEKLLTCYEFYIENNGRVEPITCLVIEIFNESIYEMLPESLKGKFINHVVFASTFAKDNSLPLLSMKLIKKLNIDARCIIPALEAMRTISDQDLKTKKIHKIKEPSLELVNNPQWKIGITVLEILQNKKKLINYEKLFTILFDLLKKCLEFEEQSILEYLKQLILSCLLLCYQKSSQESKKATIGLSESTYPAALVVQCIRATKNPQTHHHALLLLSHMALLTPQEVLHNMMDIFTFMGSSVIRHDDSFSFQIISNIIESIVPTLVKLNSTTSPEEQEKLVIPVLKVFADIILDVPEHRRLPLYIKLIRTLDASKYLWMFLCLLFASQVTNDEKEKMKRSPKVLSSGPNELPKRFKIALHITKDFETDVILQTFLHLFNYLQDLPLEKVDNNEKIEVDTNDITLFDVGSHSAKQLRHYTYIILQYISTYSSSLDFLNAIALLTEEETKDMKVFYQNFIIKILSYIPLVTKTMEGNSHPAQTKFWKIILHHCYEILDNAISLLSPDMFLAVIHGLLQHQILAVRKKVIEMLTVKLQNKTEFFANCNDGNFLQLLNPLNEIIDSILEKNNQMENSSSNEIMFIQQITLIALKLLSKMTALKHVEEFKEVLVKLTKILKKHNSIPKIILATVVLSITEISSNLRAHSIAHLSKFMPHLIEVLLEQSEILVNNPPENVCIAIITGMQKLFETLPLFLGPYIVDVLSTMALMWKRTLSYKDQDQDRTTIVITKLESIWNKIATVIPLRILIPNCHKAYKKLMNEHHYGSVQFLMKILLKSFENAVASDVQSLQTEITDLFLDTLEFRSVLVNYKKQDEVTSTEESILDAFVTQILKLSESYFRPLFHKVYEWSIGDSTSKDKKITFFILSSKVAESLKSLFVLFASDLIQDAADLLDKCNANKSEELYFSNSEYKNSLLIESILKTLYIVFLHDSKTFINRHRFDTLMQPIVDQLENSIIKNESMKELLLTCLSQLAVVVSNDTLWKQLNYQILLKTRSNNPENRILAFNCCVEIVRKLGESFSSLLPETIPFVAELLEDENEKVEQNCRKGVQEMEKILGESLQSYF